MLGAKVYKASSKNKPGLKQSIVKKTDKRARKRFQSTLVSLRVITGDQGPGDPRRPQTTPDDARRVQILDHPPTLLAGYLEI